MLHVNEAMKKILFSYGPEKYSDYKFEIKYIHTYIEETYLFIYLFVVYLITISAARIV